MRKVISMILVLCLFMSCCGQTLAETLKLPSNLVTVEEQAFDGDLSLQTVDLPWGTESIGRRAFAGSGLTDIYIPGTVTFIAEDAFDGSENVVIHAPNVSTAREFAQEHNIPWEDARTHYMQDQLDYLLVEQEPLPDFVQTIELNQETDAEILALQAEYIEGIEELNQLFLNLSAAMETNVLSVDGDMISLTTESFDFTLDGSLSGDYYSMGEILTSGKNVQMELTGSGRTAYLLLNESGISVVENPILTAGSASSNTRKVLRAVADNTLVARIQAVINNITSTISEIDVLLSSLTVRAADELARLYNEFQQAQVAGNYMRCTELQSALDRATIQFNAIDRFAKFWAKVSIAGNLTAIATDIGYYNELAQFERHGHPLWEEQTDEYLQGIVDRLLHDISVGQGLLIGDMIANVFSIIVSIDRIFEWVPIPGLMVARLGIQAARITIQAIANLVAGEVGLWLGNLAVQHLHSARAEDEQLHTVIYGYISDEVTDKLLENAEVTDGFVTVTTGISGFYKIHLAPEPTTLKFTCEGYKKKEIVATPVANQEIQLDIELKPKTWIMNREDLEAVAEDPDDDYIIGADIDLSEEPWTPLPVFRGTLDGNGHTISGMTIQGEYEDTNVGLFNYLEGTISNLTLTNMTINISARGQFCNAHSFGSPDNIWGNSWAPGDAKLDNCHVSGNVTIYGEPGCGTGFSALAGACNSDANVNIHVEADNFSQRALWKCSLCSYTGTVNLTYTGQANGVISMMEDCIRCQGNVQATVQQNGQPIANTSVSGIASNSIVSRHNQLSGKIYHEGNTYGVNGTSKGAVDCNIDARITSDMLVGLWNCTNSTLGGTLETIGKQSDVFCHLTRDSGEGDANNTVNTAYEYTEKEIMPANLQIYSECGRGTVINTPIILEDISLTNISIILGNLNYQEGRNEGDEQDELYRNGIIRVRTSSGMIYIYSSLTTHQNTYAESATGAVAVMAASYNFGNVTGKSTSNTIQVTAGSKYNGGVVLGITGSASGTSYVTGVYGGNGFNEGAVTGINNGKGWLQAKGVDGDHAWNEGDIRVEQNGTGLGMAIGAVGNYAVNMANVTSTGDGTTDEVLFEMEGWNIQAFGTTGENGWNAGDISASCNDGANVMAVGSENGTNKGAITSTGSNGYAHAYGIRGGIHNAGPVSAITGGHVARAWGAESSGTNSATITGTCTNDGAEYDAYAYAQGGHGEAIGGKGFASGKTCTATAKFSEQTVTNNQYAWMLGSHNHDMKEPCGAPLKVITTTPSFHLDAHTYFLWASATCVGDELGSLPEAPKRPAVALPE